MTASLSAEDTEALIIEFIRKHLAGDDTLDIDPEENLLVGGLMDSVGLVRLVAHLKDELGLSIPPQDLLPGNFRSVRVMSEYLQNLSKRQATAPSS